jgi:hypothetical protein
MRETCETHHIETMKRTSHPQDEIISKERSWGCANFFEDRAEERTFTQLTSLLWLCELISERNKLRENWTTGGLPQEENKKIFLPD